MFFKRVVPSDTEGDCSSVVDTVAEVTAPASVTVCVVCGTTKNVKRCGGCKSANYCSKQCQVQHWPNHSDICKATIVQKSPTVRCCLCGSPEELKGCGRCKSVSYCSRNCQKEHWSQHAEICNSIRDLEEFEKNKLYHNKTVRQNQADQQMKLKMVKLIGEKPKITCYMGGVKMKMLL